MLKVVLWLILVYIDIIDCMFLKYFINVNFKRSNICGLVKYYRYLIVEFVFNIIILLLKRCFIFWVEDLNNFLVNSLKCN